MPGNPSAACALISIGEQEAAMPDIRENAGIVTQITTVKTNPDNLDEVIALMKERARFMARQPGFVSISLHRSEDGSHVVNYVQWTDKNKLSAAHHSPEFRKKWPRFGELVQDVEPSIYNVVQIEAA
jgi:heme-degrading monooxygenase HmoA